MSLPLTMGEIQQNCAILYECSHSSLYPDPKNDKVLMGARKWNAVGKSILGLVRWTSGSSTLEKITAIVTKTLEGIEQILNTEKEKCPIFFFSMPEQMGTGMTTVTYRDLALRILRSNTLKNVVEIQDKANAIYRLFQDHPMGLQVENLTDQQRAKLKRRLVGEVMYHMAARYSSTEPEKVFYPNSETTKLPQEYDNVSELKKFLVIVVNGLNTEIKSGTIMNPNPTSHWEDL